MKQEIYEGRLEPGTQLFLSGQQKQVQRIVTGPEHNLSKTEMKKEICERRLEPRTQWFSLWTTETGSENRNRSRT
jgi:hypothetical protein